MSVFNNEYNCSTCPLRCNIFTLLNEEDLKLVNENRYEVKYKAGEIIFKQGTAANHLISFSKGIGKIYLEGYDNKNLLLEIVIPTELVGGQGIFVDRRHHFSMASLTESQACYIPFEVIGLIIRRNERFSGAFMREAGKKTVYNYQKLIDLTQKQRHGRIADALIYLSEKLNAKGEFDMLLSRQELADMTGLSKESTCRILKEFKDDKIISMHGNRVKILNDETLTKISRTG